MKNILRKFEPKTRRAKLISAVLIALALATLVGTVIYLVNRNDKPKTEPVISYSTDTPDESKANADNYNWQGAPDEPKKIIISSLGVNAFVQKAGVDQENRIAVPNNVHLASWFSESQKPGQKGLAIIDGHVSGRTTDGVFKNLGNMKVGDSFEIERGDGKILKYEVIANKQIAEAKSADILFSQDPKVTSQVNLITCGGQFDKTSDQYKDRIIVSGKLVN